MFSTGQWSIIKIWVTHHPISPDSAIDHVDHVDLVDHVDHVDHVNNLDHVDPVDHVDLAGVGHRVLYGGVRVVR